MLAMSDKILVPPANGFDWPLSDFEVVPTAHQLAEDFPFAPWKISVPFLKSYWLGIHPGIDASIPGTLDQGAPIYAVAHGIVTAARIILNSNGKRSSWGFVIVIRHEGEFPYEGVTYNKVWSQYAHIVEDRVLVKKGDIVQRGQVIAFVGNAGGYYSSPEGYHLHFAIARTRALEINPGHWPGGARQAVIDNYVNPIKFIKQNRRLKEPVPMPDEQPSADKPLVVLNPLGLNLRASPDSVNGKVIRLLKTNTILTPVSVPFKSDDLKFDFQAFYVPETNEIGYCAVRVKSSGQVWVGNPQ